MHPLLTESVTNIAGRADLLTALTICLTLGLFSKENAAVLPAIMLLYDLTWSNRATWRGRAASYAALALPFAAFFFLRSEAHTDLRVFLIDNPLIGAGFWTARLTALKVIGKFLWLFVWPAHLSADYSYNAIPLFGWRLVEWEDAKALVALGVCLGAVWLAIRWHRTRKSMFFFLVFFFLALSPTSNMVILIGSIMAERFAYLPSIGLAGCTVAAIHWLGRRIFEEQAVARQATWITLGVVGLAFGTRTYARNFDWYDAQTLWRSALNASAQNAKAHMDLGNALALIPDRLMEAVAEYEAALQVDPNYAEAHNNLGAALMRLPDRLPEAIAEYETALRIDPRYAHAHNNLGSALSLIAGRPEDAIAEYRAALRSDPNYAKVHTNLGNVLSEMPGRLREAIAEYEAALQINPDDADAHYGLGGALAQTPGGLQEAIAEFETVLRITPDHAGAHNNLGNVLAQIPGQMREAIVQFKLALRIDPTLARAHSNLGIALSRMPERRQEAITEFEAALRIRPDPIVQQMLDRLRKAPRISNGEFPGGVYP